MTTPQFIAEIGGVFSPYNQTQRKYVQQFLSKRSEKAISIIFSEVLKSFSPTSTNPRPGISELTAAWEEIKAHRMHELMPKPLMLEESDIDPEEAKRMFRELNYKIATMAKEKRI